MTISEAFTLYDQHVLVFNGMTDKTRKNYQSSLHSFLKHVGDVPVELICLDHFNSWSMSMNSYGCSGATVSGYFSGVREVFKFLRKRGLNVLDSRDIELPRVKRKDPVWLEYGEVQDLIDFITSPRDKAIVACLFSTGCRVAELLNLNRDDIVDGQATVIGKGDKQGTVYFDAQATKLLNDYLDGRKDNLRPLFVSGQYRRITVSRIEQLLHIYADNLGLKKNVTPHVLRHSYASDLKLNGADIYDIKELLRHSQISSTMIYTHINPTRHKQTYTQFHSNS